MNSITPAEESAIYRFFREPGRDYLTMQWRGYANSNQFRQGTERMLEEMRRHNVHKVLADIRDMVLIGTEDQNWLQDEFLPRAIRDGFQAIALLQPLHYFNKVAVESIAYKVQSESLRIRMFNGLNEAVAWLEDHSTGQSV